MTNLKVIDKFFECYGKRDFDSLRQVVAADVIWYFEGLHDLAGVRKGFEELIAFFDIMGGIMARSKPAIEKLIVAEAGIYAIECQHIRTNRPDGINIDHYVTVLWTIENGKIISGRHFFADPVAVDKYFNAVAESIDKDDKP